MSRSDVVAATVVGLLLVVGLWVLAALSLCGISGCSGAGFGRDYSPGWVLGSLLLSGPAAAAGPFAQWRLRPSRRPLALAGALLVVVPILGGLIVGAGPDGYPRSITPAERETDRERQLGG